jgi:hypothetical protein
MQEIVKIDTINASNQTTDCPCYVLNSNLDDTFCTSFINNAIKEQKIVLFYGDNAVEMAKKYNASGIITDLGSTNLKQQMESLKKELPKKSIIGLFSRSRRHEAMLVSELEPDFIIFKVWSDGIEKTAELLDWYNDFFIIQSCAWLEDDNIDLSLINADFFIK